MVRIERIGRGRGESGLSGSVELGQEGGQGTLFS